MDVGPYLLTANVPSRLAIPFRFFMLVEASAPISVEFLARGSLSKTGEVGRSVEAGYKKFPLDPTDVNARWGGVVLTSTSTQTVRIGFSDDAGDYGNFVQNVLAAISDALTSTPDVTTIAGTALEIKAANAGRRKIHVTAHTDNDSALRIGDSAITTSRGLRLGAGLTLTLETTAAVYAIRESGSNNQSVSILEET